MSAPDNFNWGEVAPEGPADGADGARAASQVRIMFAMGKSRIDVQIWLEENGFSPEEAVAFLEKQAPLSHQRFTTSQLGGIVGASIGGFLSLVVTLVLQPWSATWVATRAGARGIETATVDPVIAVGFYWIGGLFMFTLICGGVGMIFGEAVNRMIRGDSE